MENKNNTPDRFLRMLGLCRRAGLILCGVPPIADAMHGNHRPVLVIAARDASEATRKKLRTKCEFYGVELLLSDYPKEMLAATVGKTGETAALGVLDAGFARELLQSSGRDVSGTMETGR